MTALCADFFIGGDFMDFDNIATGLGVAGVLAWVVRWLLTEGKQTLDKNTDALDKLANSIDKSTKASEATNNKLDRIEIKVEKLHDDIKDLKHEIGG